jgi:hypothetical protein
LRSLISKAMFWYDKDVEDERDRKTEQIHDRADRAVDTAEMLIRSYAEADAAISEHRKIWRTNGV